MNRNTVFVICLMASVALVWIPGALAIPEYLDAYNATYTPNGTCDVCHVNAADGGPRNSYGMLFENQSNHATDPGAALIAIGSPSGMTSTAAETATPDATLTPVTTEIPIEAPITTTETPIETPTITTEIPIEAPITTTETPIETPTITTEIPIEAPITTTEIPTETPAPETPGFEQGVFIVGLLACYFLLKRSNNN